MAAEEERMEFELTSKRLVLILVFFGVGAAAGYAAGNTLTMPGGPLSCPTELNLSEADANLVIAAGLTGHCEKMGLRPSILIQDSNGTPYGVPICVENQRS